MALKVREFLILGENEIPVLDPSDHARCAPSEQTATKSESTSYG
jgi:hypothetical protein